MNICPELANNNLLINERHACKYVFAQFHSAWKFPASGWRYDSFHASPDCVRWSWQWRWPGARVRPYYVFAWMSSSFFVGQTQKNAKKYSANIRWYLMIRNMLSLCIPFHINSNIFWRMCFIWLMSSHRLQTNEILLECLYSVCEGAERTGQLDLLAKFAFV